MPVHPVADDGHLVGQLGHVFWVDQMILFP